MKIMRMRKNTKSSISESDQKELNTEDIILSMMKKYTTLLRREENRLTMKFMVMMNQLQIKLKVRNNKIKKSKKRKKRKRRKMKNQSQRPTQKHKEIKCASISKNQTFTTTT